MNKPRIIDQNSMFALELINHSVRHPFIAKLWWLCHGRPYIRVEMEPRTLQLAGCPQPELGHIDVRSYEYHQITGAIHERAMAALLKEATDV